MKLTQKRLKETLRYCPATGEWMWLKTLSNRSIRGNFAGSVYGNGYKYIKINGKRFKASRLAWFYMTNGWPEKEIDHKDRNPLNDKWNNLRDVSSSINKLNTKIRIDSTSKVKGVHKNKRQDDWEAYIYVNKKKKYLGRFKESKNAIIARKNAEIKYYNIEGLTI